VLDKADETLGKFASHSFAFVPCYNGNLVQKVLPLPAAIKNLCNMKQPGSFGEERIAFNELATIPFNITGVYGRQELICRFLVQIGAVKPDQYLLLLLLLLSLLSLFSPSRPLTLSPSRPHISSVRSMFA
jgi:hypothetical protein